MVGLKEWFEAKAYKPKYEFGARVIGKYRKMPFVGCVGTDGIRSEEEGPILTVTLDLPLMVDGIPRTVLIVKHKDVKPYK
jgi:hypothetical protein